MSLEKNGDKNPEILTLERIFADKEFDSKGFGPVRWLEDERGYLFVESAEPEKKEDAIPQIVYCDMASGASRVFISAEQLTADGAEKPFTVANFSWSEEAQRLLIFTNTKKVWRLHTRGDYWVLDVKSGQLKQLGGKDAAPSSLMFAKFSPDGRLAAYVRENNIYVENLENGEITPLTTDGSDIIINGTTDWVYEEELHLRDCFLWSPDGRYIAYWQIDISEVDTFHLINNTDALYPEIKSFPYPKIGRTNPACRVGVVSAVGGETTWFEVEGDPRNHYIHQMAWCPDSAEVAIQQANRYQNCNKVIFGTVSDGSVEVVLVEEDESWVDFHNGLKMVEDGRAFTWLSERDGWSHLYLVSRSGDRVELLTPGDYDVVDVPGVDEAGGWVYFRASPENPTQLYLYRVALDGSGRTERLTPADLPGTHDYKLSPKGSWAFHTYTTFDSPPVVALVSLPEHGLVKMVEENRPLQEKLAALNRQLVEFFKVQIEEDVVLDGWCMKPPDFDPNKKYPLLFHIYGEPSGRTVVDGWSGTKYLWHLALTQLGFVVMSVESSGTPQPRGRCWRKRMYKRVGTMSAADQAAALRVLLGERPYLDPERVGIWGWSGGGTMTLNMLFRYPELYKTGASVAPVTDQRLYDTIYQERYMGALEENEEAYIEGSPITHAHKLAGNLLLIHGTGDDNVHYQATERLINELVKHNKPFTMMAYPNRTHSINEGKNTSLHLHELMRRYLVEHLLGK